MNKYQREIHKKAKEAMKRDKFGRITYRQAKRFCTWWDRVYLKNIDPITTTPSDTIKIIANKIAGDIVFAD